MTKKVILSLMSSVMILTGCQTSLLGQKKPQADFVYTNQQKCEDPVQLKVGQTFRFNAAENVTTGYYWALTSFDDTLLKVEQSYVSDYAKPNMVGVGGTKSFIFTALKSGQTAIELHHGRGGSRYDSVSWQCKIQISDAIQ